MLLLLAPLLIVACLADTNTVVVGNVRVQALSPRLVRIEPKGPMGFENRTTFMVVGRDSFGAGVPLTLVNQSNGVSWLSTPYYSVMIVQTTPSGDACGNVQDNTDFTDPSRSPSYAQGAEASSQQDCCNLCTQDQYCKAWVYAPTSRNNNGSRTSSPQSQANCWPINGYAGVASDATDRQFGCTEAGCTSPVTAVKVTDPAGNTLWSWAGPPSNLNYLHWPDPTTTPAYAITDYPRFFAPAWGPAPPPANASIPPELQATNGYDFRNSQNGDMYIFLLGTELASWHAARKDFITLTGPTPLLPDFAFGTWFTWWHSYTQAEAVSDVLRWEADKLPIDVWALDMNWRNTSNLQDRFYDHPNTALFPNFTEWFEFLESKGLRTYFNDHPFPVDMQTSNKEVAFRWNGLSEWMERGLTYWWFDRNWFFSIPAPEIQPVGGWNVSLTGGSWDGLDNAGWGSHLYHTAVSVFNQRSRPANFPRAITLTKFAPPDWRPGQDPKDASESPAQHRYPVWWTGDGVPLQASVESMVNTGVYDFKPYVHSDCGGDGRGTADQLLRWTAHCAFGSILRFHGADHRAWTYGNTTEGYVRDYLNMRYKLIPSLIAAGYTASQTAFPIVARGDLFWPTFSEANTADQYLYLNDTLVAPVWESNNQRSVWIPPGSWQYAWDGSVVTGPQTVSSTTPSNQQPMWHRRGGVVLMASNVDASPVDRQDWSSMTADIFPEVGPNASDASETRFVAERSSTVDGRSDVFTHVHVHSVAKSGMVKVVVMPHALAMQREWVLRLHLRPGQTVSWAESSVSSPSQPAVQHLQPLSASSMDTYRPFGGSDTRPAVHAGAVAQVKLAKVREQVSVVFHIN